MLWAPGRARARAASGRRGLAAEGGVGAAAPQLAPVLRLRPGLPGRGLKGGDPSRAEGGWFVGWGVCGGVVGLGRRGGFSIFCCLSFSAKTWWFLFGGVEGGWEGRSFSDFCEDLVRLGGWENPAKPNPIRCPLVLCVNH